MFYHLEFCISGACVLARLLASWSIANVYYYRLVCHIFCVGSISSPRRNVALHFSSSLHYPHAPRPRTSPVPSHPHLLHLRTLILSCPCTSAPHYLV
ncbi:hypothetical protein C8Q74DRAFT_565077 [Fomes fomentarius]|nr:hypothetical protein C8Q74DRAFT_565077 [Fomes fomentarius]